MRLLAACGNNATRLAFVVDRVDLQQHVDQKGPLNDQIEHQQWQQC